MTFAKRAATAGVTLAVLILAAAYLPPPVSTVAGIILAGFALLLLLPLILMLIGMVFIFISDDDDGGPFSDISDAWFMWSVLDWLGLAFKWPWIASRWMFTRFWPESAEKRKRDEGPPFNREA